jgi:hypothetical protein
LEDVEIDLRGINFKMWRKKAVVRDEWSTVIEEAKAPRVPMSQIIK